VALPSALPPGFFLALNDAAVRSVRSFQAWELMVVARGIKDLGGSVPEPILRALESKGESLDFLVLGPATTGFAQADQPPALGQA
jgi:hypothetical protein